VVFDSSVHFFLNVCCHGVDGADDSNGESAL
jgi:hypothetical protein